LRPNSTRYPTMAACICRHLGIDRNTIADELAELHSHLGTTSLDLRNATPEGVKAALKAARRSSRIQAEFKIRRTNWHSYALSTYTLYCTKREPQKAWLHQIRKIDNTIHSCAYSKQIEEHIVLHCSNHSLMRNHLLEGKRTREDIETADWHKERDNFCNAIESFFNNVYFRL